MEASAPNPFESKQSDPARKNVRQFGMISAVPMSFFSGELYRDIGRHWKGFGFWYLTLLLAVCWIPGMVRVHFQVTKAIYKDGDVFFEQIPPIDIRDGIVTVEAEQPHYIKDPESGTPFMILDTTGEVTSLDGLEAGALLTETKIITKKANGRTEIIDLSSVEEFHLDSGVVRGWAETFSLFVAPVGFLFAWLGSLVYRLLAGLVYGAIGLGIASSKGVQLSYGSLLRMSVVAMTPSIIMSSIFGFFNVPTYWLWWWPVCIGATVALLALGIGACEGPEESAPEMETVDTFSV
jgi:hypothetical protein